MKKSDTLIPYIQLVGDEKENIYQLGLKDREGHKALFEQIHHFLTLDISLIDQATLKLGRWLVKKNKESNPEYYDLINQYAQGLGRDSDEVGFAFLIPELASAMSEWAPGLPVGLLGCSSFFILDETSHTPIHGRVLDFPVAGSFDKNERLLRTQFRDQAQIFSIGTAGFPLGGITAMNSHGVTLALHQKFTPVLSREGVPIFQLAQEVLRDCQTPEDVLKLLRKRSSITTWAMYMSFAQTNEVMELDIMGDQLHYHIHPLNKGDVLYFNNKVIDPKFEQQRHLPYGMQTYNELRELNAREKMKKFQKKGKFNAQELLKMMSTPLKEHHKGVKDAPMKEAEYFDTLTPSSVTVATMNPGKQEVLGIRSEAPKTFQGLIYHAKNIFQPRESTLEQKMLSGKKVDEDYHRGLYHLAHAQVAYDCHDHHMSYHHIQMAIALLKRGPLHYYARFFLCVFEFIQEKHPKMRTRLYRELEQIRPFVHDYLKDQITLMLIRCDRLQGQTSRFTMDDIQHPTLKKIYRLEEKISVVILSNTVWKVLNPRIDIMDVIGLELKS